MTQTRQYLDLVKYILENGQEVKDRTGVGTISCFGLPTMTFDLQQSFPLLTAKKTPFKGVVEELRWFISGSDNINDLDVSVQHWWKPWANKNGTLNHMYGEHFRNFGIKCKVQKQPLPVLQRGINATYLGVANGEQANNHFLKKTWEGMISRCYNPNDIQYKNYGDRGCFVVNEWLYFPNFAKDAEKLPGFSERIGNSRKITLDKDGIGDGFCYGPKTTQWISQTKNSEYRSNKIYIVRKDGLEYSFTNPSQFCRENDISDKNFSDLWTSGKKIKRYGYEFVKIIDRNKGIDQLTNLVEGIKNNPTSRRHVVTTWNPETVDLQPLACCHGTVIQCYVRGSYLDMATYQRSADAFLGLPVNIASYSLLLTFIAELTGYKPGKLFYTLGDVHVYSNHVEQCKEMLSRPLLPEPKLTINNCKTWNDFKYENFTLVGYNPHPSIKGELAI